MYIVGSCHSSFWNVMVFSNPMLDGPGKKITNIIASQCNGELAKVAGQH